MRGLAPILFDPITQDIERLVSDDGFPSKVHVISTPDGRYCGYCFGPEQIHGITCFLTSEKASEFTPVLESPTFEVLEVTFDEAVEVVIMRRRHVPLLKCLFLMDGGDCPKATYWVP